MLLYGETINKINTLLETDTSLTSEVKDVLEESKKKLQQATHLEHGIVAAKVLMALLSIAKGLQ